MVVEETGAPEVGEEVVGGDLVGGVASPGVGVAYADLQGVEFGYGFGFGGGAIHVMASRRWWKAARRLATRASAWALASGGK